ncbi:hypothetical protein SARC_05585 [Sphaeroforma arctica JP610]|uniref:Transcription initiation factor TFIID subunit 1 histone acetyltransferase domain-containing protein n=1 Tax=Sphaeroforma arctica JP610 TaxID=667725 RepID=A0A0L0FZX8_9EUKA|nr:hypothetical protein SARC_05585 [Sphaeroforma arctica JP610]KNC82116.1 hypothetical protein SARC_05585 [Sphaeroforma arctica JP610]|eukprot:XP_014156018.1 hypothetical protein SARC_05585 [Sphaeroforma arctica JP610]
MPKREAKLRALAELVKTINDLSKPNESQYVIRTHTMRSKVRPIVRPSVDQTESFYDVEVLVRVPPHDVVHTRTPQHLLLPCNTAVHTHKHTLITAPPCTTEINPKTPATDGDEASNSWISDGECALTRQSIDHRNPTQSLGTTPAWPSADSAPAQEAAGPLGAANSAPTDPTDAKHIRVPAAQHRTTVGARNKCTPALQRTQDTRAHAHTRGCAKATESDYVHHSAEGLGAEYGANGAAVSEESADGFTTDEGRCIDAQSSTHGGVDPSNVPNGRSNDQGEHRYLLSFGQEYSVQGGWNGSDLFPLNQVPWEDSIVLGLSDSDNEQDIPTQVVSSFGWDTIRQPSDDDEAATPDSNALRDDFEGLPVFHANGTNSLTPCPTRPTTHAHTHTHTQTHTHTHTHTHSCESTAVDSAVDTNHEHAAVHVLSPIRQSLWYDLWEDDVIWEDYGCTNGPTAAEKDFPVVLDMNDRFLIFDDVIEGSEGDSCGGMRRQAQLELNSDGSGKAGHDMYNLSNDKCFVRPPDIVHRKEHAQCARVLQPPFYRIGWTPLELRNWHRSPLSSLCFSQREKDITVEGLHLKTAKDDQPEMGNIRELRSINTVEDLSSMDGDLILIEYSEEEPPILSKVGMTSQIVNYHKMRREGSTTTEETAMYNHGTDVTLKEDDHLIWLLGELHPGQSMQILQSRLSRVPLFAHAQRHSEYSDFLVVRCKDKFWLRELPPVYCAGQVLPRQEVPFPRDREADKLVTELLRVWLSRVFGSASGEVTSQRKVALAEVKESFPQATKHKIGKILHEYAEARGRFWVAKPNVTVESEVQLANHVRPEDVCRFERMCAFDQKLKDLGYRFINNHFHPDESDPVDREVELAPWFTTRNYVDAIYNRCQLAVCGFGDPTGCGQGYSFLRRAIRPIGKCKGRRRCKLSTHHKADLRKETNGEVERLLRDRGVTDEQCPRTFREKRKMLRMLANQDATVDGDDSVNATDSNSCHAQPQKQSRVAYRQAYINRCQSAYDSQRVALSASTDPPTPTPTPERSDDDEESLDDLAQSIEDMLQEESTTPETGNNTRAQLRIKRVYVDALGQESVYTEHVDDPLIIDRYIADQTHTKAASHQLTTAAQRVRSGGPSRVRVCSACKRTEHVAKNWRKCPLWDSDDDGLSLSSTTSTSDNDQTQTPDDSSTMTTQTIHTEGMRIVISLNPPHCAFASSSDCSERSKKRKIYMRSKTLPDTSVLRTLNFTNAGKPHYHSLLRHGALKNASLYEAMGNSVTEIYAQTLSSTTTTVADVLPTAAEMREPNRRRRKMSKKRTVSANVNCSVGSKLRVSAPQECTTRPHYRPQLRRWSLLLENARHGPLQYQAHMAGTKIWFTKATAAAGEQNRTFVSNSPQKRAFSSNSTQIRAFSSNSTRRIGLTRSDTHTSHVHKHNRKRKHEHHHPHTTTHKADNQTLRKKKKHSNDDQSPVNDRRFKKHWKWDHRNQTTEGRQHMQPMRSTPRMHSTSSLATHHSTSNLATNHQATEAVVCIDVDAIGDEWVHNTPQHGRTASAAKVIDVDAYDVTSNVRAPQIPKDEHVAHETEYIDVDAWDDE